MKTKERIWKWTRLAAAAGMMALPGARAWGAADTTTTATASGTVATIFTVAVSGNLSMGSLPADNATYTATQTNSVTLKNNEDVAWYGKVKFGAAVAGATLEFMGGSVGAFTAMTALNQTFTSDTLTPFVNTPSGSAVTLSYRAKSDGSLVGATAVSWTITYTLSQAV